MELSYFLFIMGILWTGLGVGFFNNYQENSVVYNSARDDVLCYLNPVWLWKAYKVNVFGCFILTILFNLACPLVSIIYWIIKFIGWICTVGRK